MTAMEGTRRPLGSVNIALAIGIVTGLVYAGYDPEWFAALGGLVTAVTGLVAVIRVWQVFPTYQFRSLRRKVM